jgi:cobalt-zinc-cadmium efflux system outer membrane protein
MPRSQALRKGPDSRMGERMRQGLGRKRTALGLARAALTLPFVLFSSGCATYEPQPLEPERELAALATVDLSRVVSREASRRVGEGEAKAGLHVDPTDGLDDAELIAIALTLNPDLKTKRLEVGEAQALLITAGIWPNPEVGISWRSALGGASGYNLEAGLLFELLLPGVRSARKDAAAARIDASRARVVAAEWQLVVSVREQSLAVLSAERLAALLTEEEALRQRIVSLFTRKRELGEGTELDVVTAELELGQLQRDARIARAEVDRSRRVLNELLGLPPTYTVVLAQSGKPIPLATPPDVPDEELLRLLLHGRFELRALEALYQEAEHSLRAAVYRQYPQLKLGPSFNHEGTEGDFLGLASPFSFLSSTGAKVR